MSLSPSDDEAAAIAAAIERFQAETGPGEVAVEEAIGPWQRAALAEGVSAKGLCRSTEKEELNGCREDHRVGR